MTQGKHDERLVQVLEAAALLQEKVPDAVLVGGSVAALYAEHRLSFDHDHVLADLQERFALVLDALEADPEYIINRITPGKIILGEQGGIEYGIRQMLRKRPLEVQEEILPSGKTVVVPTRDECLRIKAYLIVKRNQTRDYVDVAALCQVMGIEHAARVLSAIDQYYTDPVQDVQAVSTQILTMLLSTQPRDVSVTKNLKNYRNLHSRWHNWKDVCEVLTETALAMN